MCPPFRNSKSNFEKTPRPQKQTYKTRSKLKQTVGFVIFVKMEEGMIQCMSCKKWEHAKCAEVSENTRKYYCTKCKKKWRYLNNVPAGRSLLNKKWIASNVTKLSPLFLLAATPVQNEKIITQITTDDVEENLLHLITLARVAMERGEISRAEAILQMGLKVAEERKVYFALPHLYEILVSIAFAESNFEKAENLLVNIIEKLVQTGTPENDHYIIDFKLRLARIYSGDKKPELAEIGFKTCLEDQKLKLLEGDYSMRTGLLYINCLFWYGVHKIRNEQYADAKQMLDDAYEFSTKIKGLSPYQEMVILYTLSDINSELGKHEIALENMLNAILLGKGISSVDLPRCYVKLAKLYVELGSYENAKLSAMEGAKLARMFNDTELAEEADVILMKME